MLLFMLTITGLFVYATYEYTSYFNNIYKFRFVWLFILMGLIFFSSCLVVYNNWKKIYTITRNVLPGESKKSSAKNAVMAFYADTFINGPLFLWKLYIVEF